MVPRTFGPALMASIILLRSCRASPNVIGARSFRLGQGDSRRWASTNSIFKSYLVAPQELFNVLKGQRTATASSRVIPLCASWFLPNDEQKRTGWKVFEERRIPNARFFDIDDIKDHESSYPHMLPTAEGFAESMSGLGLKRDDYLVVYDSYEQGIFSAPRVAFTLKVFGHSRVHILNNFKLWVDQGYPTESGKLAPELWEKSTYPIPNINPDRVACFRDVRSIAQDFKKAGSEKTQIIDARSAGRFSGSIPEPRPTISSGHVPGSFNIPLPEILDPNTKAFLPKDELRKLFMSKGLDPSKRIVSSCGTGVMAAALDVALGEADFGAEENRRVYDGSWTYVPSPSCMSFSGANLHYREYAQRVKPEEGLIIKQA